MKDNILFEITVEDLQAYAISKIGRNLCDFELEIAKEGIENALLFDIETVYNTIVSEMI